MIILIFSKLFLGFSLMSLALGMPTWQGLTSRSLLGSLVSGVTLIEAHGPVRNGQWSTPNYLTINTPRGARGVPGNATIAQSNFPQLFFINHDQLWQYTNETSILPVNIHNITGQADVPLQLRVGNKREGITNGSWRWRGTMLYYDEGERSNQGLFYSCQDKRGEYGVYMLLDSEPSPTPVGCHIVTLHSFSQG